MDTGKLIGLLILMILTIPIGGFVWVPILFLGWKYVKLCIKVDLIVIYLAIRVPVWLFIQLPLHTLGVVTSEIGHFFSGGYNKFKRNKKLAVSVQLLNGAIFAFFLFPLSSMQPLNPSFWIGTVFSLGLIVLGSGVLTLLILAIKSALGGSIAQREMPDTGGELTSMAEGAVGAAGTAKETAEKARGVYNEIQVNTEGAASTASEEGLLSADMEAVIGELAEVFGMDAAGAEAAGAAAGEAAAVASNPAGWAAIAIVVAAAVVFVLQLILVLGFFIFYLQLLAPVVLGPVTAALGLGSDYGNYVGGEVADRYVAGIQINMEQYMDPVIEARQRVYCLLEGPACLRAWRLNNTRNPGSESVGEQYLLDIDRLEVGSGNRLDIAYKNRDYEIPVSFGLSNSRNGLKGINAYNVSYRIRVIDFDRGRNDPFCDTNWKPIDGYNISSRDGKFSGNDLYPGTAATTGFLTINDFTLEDCGMLQPGAGQTRTVILDVKYDYFSQATLYFDAMAQETLISNPDIEKSWKESETADTPVKSALNVNSPVVYNQDTLQTGSEDTAAQPFSMRASLYTEESNVEYQIKELRVRKSSAVEKVENAQNCRLNQSDRENILKPSGESSNILKDHGGGARWFDSTNNPPFFGCTMQLSNPAEISPEGETLTMGVESNYTVKLNEPLERFRVLNTRCANAGINCPLLVTESFANNQEDSDNWKYTCDGPDAGRSGETAGCSVVKGDGDWSRIQQNMLTGDDMLDSRLARGEIAVDPEAFDYIDLDTGEFDYSEGESAIGLTESEKKRLQNSAVEGDSKGVAVVSVQTGDSRDVEIQELEYIVCNNRANVEDYRDYFINNLMSAGDKLISFSPVALDCNQNLEGSDYAQAAADSSTASLSFGPFAYLTEIAVRGTYSKISDTFEEEQSQCSTFRLYDPSTESLRCMPD
ncbi:MAG: hypothetical protein ACI9LV_000086 [Candidatus Nanohaloarchaea archaeon]